MIEQSTTQNISPEPLTESSDLPPDELERQVERAGFYTHTAIGRNSIRLAEVESFLYGIVDVLLSNGQISSEQITQAVENVRQELASQGDVPNAGVSLRIDAQTESRDEEVLVNCTERMPICNAICCKLDFALTHDEVETGKIKWDLGRPYYIRHGKNGFCVHNDRKRGCCSLYEDRPAICKNYSCANDTRIWKDFEKMQLNVEWLTENLSGSSLPRLKLIHMQNTDHIYSMPNR